MEKKNNILWKYFRCRYRELSNWNRWGNYWDGYIDELTIWSGVELGEDDVTKIYENQKIGKEGATAGEIILTDDGEFIGWNGTKWKII